ANDRDGVHTDTDEIDRIGAGGLSGPPIAKRSTRLINYLYQKTAGDIPIIGVGGIDSGAAAYEKIRAGASLVQLYTGLVYEGPSLVKRIKQELVQLIAEDGYTSIAHAIGTASTD
ncbi:MAG: quinone-dependent dihydroorotate dehydrogenase, partial [Rhodothermales bacterium]|nr:quinone-dependent dihydroorotate dehydrogenase [Rhodothermales bacterium]